MNGKLGHGSTANKTTPTLVAALSGVRIRSVATGSDHSILVTTLGSVFTFGAARSPPRLS